MSLLWGAAASSHDIFENLKFLILITQNPQEELLAVLTMMVGANISPEQLLSIAERTILEADEDKDELISFEEFVKVSLSLTFCSSELSYILIFLLTGLRED